MMDYCLIALMASWCILICWQTIALPMLQKRNVNPYTLGIITSVLSEAVSFSEQMYKEGKTRDRKKLAYEKTIELLTQMGLDYERFLPVLDWLMEAAVKRLPKTHN